MLRSEGHTIAAGVVIEVSVSEFSWGSDNLNAAHSCMHGKRSQLAEHFNFQYFFQNI